MYEKIGNTGKQLHTAYSQKLNLPSQLQFARRHVGEHQTNLHVWRLVHLYTNIPPLVKHAAVGDACVHQALGGL